MAEIIEMAGRRPKSEPIEDCWVHDKLMGGIKRRAVGDAVLVLTIQSKVEIIPTNRQKHVRIPLCDICCAGYHIFGLMTGRVDPNILPELINGKPEGLA